MKNSKAILPLLGLLLDAGVQANATPWPNRKLTDTDIARLLVNTPEHLLLQFMQNYQDLIKDDNNYWNWLGTAWKASGNFKDQEAWIVLFKKDRRNPRKIMKTSERREFAKLPKKVIAYRAYRDEVEITDSICWSIDPKFVNLYAQKKGYQVAKKEFSSTDIFAYFNRRQESEILVWRNEGNA